MEWKSIDKEEPPLNKKLVCDVKGKYWEDISTGHFQMNINNGRKQFVADCGGSYEMWEIKGWLSIPANHLKSQIISFKSSFKEILGENSETFTEDQRKSRWEQWKNIAIAEGGKELVEAWTNSEACEGCIHLKDKWCESQGLPCTVNPILSFNDGVIGMACMGSGKEENNQLEIF
jgi:hypothetical protein